RTVAGVLLPAAAAVHCDRSRGRRVNGQPCEQARGGGVRAQHAWQGVQHGELPAVPRAQVGTLRADGARGCVAGGVGGPGVYRAVTVQRVQREQPLQVDRVVLRREVEQVAEAVQRGRLQLLRAAAFGGVGGEPAKQGLRVEERRLHVV